MMQFEQIQTFGKDGIEALMKSVGAVSKGSQAGTAEIASYAKRSFEQGTAMVEKLAGARTIETVMQVQGEYLRSFYEGFVAQATRMGHLATDTAREAIAPVEGLAARTVPNA